MKDFVPKQYKVEPITIRIPFEKLQKIDQLAEESGLSRSKFINQCIDFAIEHLAKEEQ
jgi:metal-responsive CopG/Arc/MetJ family transcriptional regulator